jgi:hypothetical protein
MSERRREALTPGRHRRGRFGPSLLLAGLLCTLSPGCGTLAAPVNIAPTSQTTPPGAAAEAALAIQPAEGRPQGLLLRLTTDFQPDPGSRLELRRRVGDAPPETLRTIAVGGEVAGRLTGEGLDFLDRSVAPGRLHVYQLVYRPKSDERRTSAPLTVTWQKPPATPTGLHAFADTPVAVELNWRASAPGALVFRRNVLDKNAKTRRIAHLGPSAGGRYVDRDVEPGGVYAYRIALARPGEGFTQYGPPSEPLYVSVPGDK